MRESFSVFLIGLIALCHQNATRAEEQPSNFTVFLTDDQGWEDLGCYEHPIIKSPNLDQFASENLRLTQCYADWSGT